MPGGGAWRGPEASFGGMPSTSGMKNKSLGEKNGPPIKSGRARGGCGALYRPPYWRQWLVIFLCIAAVAALGVLPPLAVRGILDQAIPGKNLPLLYFYVGAIIGLTLLTGLISLLQNYISARVGESIIFDLRNDLFQHLQKMSLPFYT